MKRAQMTLFLLIGVVLIAAFLFINYLGEISVTQQLPAESERVITNVLRSGALNVLVTTCLENAAKDGVELVGLQGGNIYVHQNGTIPSNTKGRSVGCPEGYSGCRVGYGIELPEFKNGSDYPPPPGYPGKRQVPNLNFTKWGRFGKFSLRALCDTQGSNAPWSVTGTSGVTIGTRVLEAVFTPICNNNMYADTGSSQEQLEAFIGRRLDMCVNWTDFRLKTGYNVTESRPFVNVTYGPTNILVRASYPLLVKVGGIEPVVRRAEFKVNIQVRLKTLAELASFMATYDSYKLLFNISQDFIYLGGVDSFINVSVISPYRNNDIFDDFIIIEDRASKIEGRNYVYQFVRENRIPALDMIGEKTAYGDYDIVTLENRNISIDPHGYDPDEDNVSYFYFGWKETDDAVWDNDIGKVVVSENTYPREWTDSGPYIETHRNATYQTSHLDIGAHNLTVFACDEFLMRPLGNQWAVKDVEGRVRPPEPVDIDFLKNMVENPLCDWQIVRIFVFDVPVLNATTRNYYDDIPNQFASLEDPYVLDASGTTSVFTYFSQLVWKDDLEPFELIKEVADDPSNLRIMLPQGPFNITDIQWNKPPGHIDDKLFTVPGLHEVNFTVNVPAAPVLSLPVNVTECLPHKNPHNPFPYPYQNFKPNGIEQWVDGDDYYLDGVVESFQAEHACCNDGGVRIFDASSTASSPDVLLKHGFGKDPSELDFTVISKLTGAEIEGFAVKKNKVQSVIKIFINGKWVETHVSVLDLDSFNITPDNAPFPPGPITVYVRDTSDTTEWGTYAASTKVCYGQQPQFGGPFALRSDAVPETSIPWHSSNLRKVKLSGAEHDFNVLWTDPNYKMFRNDFFKVTRQRLCGSTVQRGNVCGGPFKELLQPHYLCADEPTVESCVGALNYSYDLGNIPPENVACHEFTDTTYEYFMRGHGMKNAKGEAPTGLCIDVPKCGGTKDTNNPDGPYLSKGTTCSGGACTKNQYGASPPYSSTPADQDACYWWNGRVNPEEGSPYACTPAANPPNWDSGQSRFKTPRYDCASSGDSAVADGCSGTLSFLDDVITDGMDLDAFAASCNDPSLAVLPAGEAGVGGYCTNGFALPNCAYSPNTPDFCGDQKFEVVSANFQSDKVCCDGRDDAGNDLNGMECVDMTGACSDTLSPLESNQPITQQETGSQCWDGVDNDCDGFVDQFDQICWSHPDDDGRIMCGSATSFCNTWADGEFGEEVEGMECLQNEIDVFAGDNIEAGLCECTDTVINGNMVQFSKSLLPSSVNGKTFFCVPPKIPGTVDMVFNFNAAPSVLVVTPNQEYTVTAGGTYSLKLQGYPSGNCQISPPIAVPNNKITFANDKSESCILEIEKIN